MEARQCVTIALLVFPGLNFSPVAAADPPDSKIVTWNSTLRGANYGMYDEGLDDDLRVARDYGMNVLRVFLGPSDADNSEDYFGSDRFRRDLAELTTKLDRAHKFGLKIVLAASRVPGRQYLWVQDQRSDRRLWQDVAWQERLAEHWKRIAAHYRDHPAVIGYEILNEPQIEQTADKPRWTDQELRSFYAEVAGTTRDLNTIYARTVRAIREVDAETPIILSTGLWGSPMAFGGLQPVQSDDKIIYTFHWYAPETYTIWRTHKGRWAYPGEIPEDGYEGQEPPLVAWNIDTHRRRMADPGPRVAAAARYPLQPHLPR